MPTRQLVKQLVCPECGQPLSMIPVPAAAVDRNPPQADDDLDDIAEEDQNNPVEVVVEDGPVCPRCVGYR